MELDVHFNLYIVDLIVHHKVHTTVVGLPISFTVTHFVESDKGNNN
jgi:hypothetical protein